MSRSSIVALAACSSLVLTQAVDAQGKSFSGDHYTITFASGWDTVQSNSVLGKFMGLQGMATLGASPGNSVPDIDSLAVVLSDSLGAVVRKDSGGTMAIAQYEVHWQKFTYDSLPQLSALVGSAVGFPVTLRNGEFKVYNLASGGVVFSVACMSILNGVKPPYGDVEAAFATLRLNAQSGIVPLGQGPARDLWVKDGKLGGGWLKANRVYAVECYDMRGALLAHAAHAPEGTWKLPEARAEMLIRLKTADGKGMHFLVRP